MFCDLINYVYITMLCGSAQKFSGAYSPKSVRQSAALVSFFDLKLLAEVWKRLINVSECLEAFQIPPNPQPLESH